MSEIQNHNKFSACKEIHIHCCHFVTTVIPIITLDLSYSHFFNSSLFNALTQMPSDVELISVISLLSPVGLSSRNLSSFLLLE